APVFGSAGAAVVASVTVPPGASGMALYTIHEGLWWQQYERSSNRTRRRVRSRTTGGRGIGGPGWPVCPPRPVAVHGTLWPDCPPGPRATTTAACSTKVQQPPWLPLSASDPPGSADLHQRPSATPSPPDGKEKVYGSIP